jgi:DHA1 family tetracycline resistance protein-like MFS transporter
LALGLALLALLLPDKSYLFFFLNPLVAIAQGITSPNLTTVVSVQAGAEYQGEVLGINQSMLSLGQIVPPLIAGYLNTISGSLPILASGLIVLLGWAVYVFVFCKKEK